jgi:predicted nucleotidyltransferase
MYGGRLKSIVLYGSFARGQATQDSDIDLAIVLEGEVAASKEIDRLIDIITDINFDYGVLLSVYPVSEEDYRSVNSPLLLNIRKEGVAA